LSFAAPGNTALLTDVAALSTTIDENRYGVALMQAVGYEPASWQTQNVTLALLGTVTLTNIGQEGITVQTTTTTVTAAAGANVRTGTSEDFRILTALFAGATVKITGRLEDGSWLQVQLPDGRSGWISTTAVEVNLNDLPIVDTEAPQPELLYPPYTAFSLQTATGDRRCNQAWESGLLVQAPKDAVVRLLVNDRVLLLAGTLFLQAPLGTEFDIFVIDGTTQIADTEIDEGYHAVVSTAKDAAGNWLETTIRPYDFARLAPLPTEILPQYTYVGIDLSTIITPAPTTDRSPIADVLVTDPCVLTTGAGGANLRGGPGAEFPVRGALGFRETARPIGRTTGSDGTLWWELAQNVWITATVVVTGGDCVSVPQSQRIPNPLPTATPEN
jgi:Bacterial SH3 domain